MPTKKPRCSLWFSLCGRCGKKLKSIIMKRLLFLQLMLLCTFCSAQNDLNIVQTDAGKISGAISEDKAFIFLRDPICRPARWRVTLESAATRYPMGWYKRMYRIRQKPYTGQTKRIWRLHPRVSDQRRAAERRLPVPECLDRRQNVRRKKAGNGMDLRRGLCKRRHQCTHL
jgi:hypothetical protein